MKSLRNVIGEAGFEVFLVDDFQEETTDLLRKLSGSLHGGNASEVLLDAFNDDMLQNYVITYLRVS